VNNNQKRRLPQDLTPAERRRIGKVVHDDRGNAVVEWRAAPANHERVLLEVQGVQDRLTLKSEETSYDPYARARPAKGGGRGTRTDLRKLSEWIKMMRELEERRRKGGDNDAGEG